MRISERHRCRPSVVRDAEHPDPTVVIGHVLHQPVDRVVSVGGFVDRLRVAPLSGAARRPLHNELPLGLEPPANVLEDEDVSVVGQLPEAAIEDGGAPIDSVGRPLEDHGQRALLIFRRVNVGIQAHAVAHRDHDVGLSVALRVVGNRLLSARGTSRQRNNEDSSNSHRLE